MIRNLRIALIVTTIIIPMFGFGKTKKVISVEFIDQTTKEAFARSNMPVDQLPDTFEIDTTLDIGEDKWSVVSTEPVTKAEFQKSGKLKVYLAKIQYMNPNDLLYSLPTISNELAALKDTTSLDNVLIIREDDWRQIEFLDNELASEISTELDSIRKIYENERKGGAFKTLHVREKVPVPLKSAVISLDTLKKYFGIRHEFNGLAFNSAKAVVDGGFAFESNGGLKIWGQQNENGLLVCVCLSPVDDQADKKRFGQLIGDFARIHNLVFADWVTTFTATSSDADFESYLK